jgi:glycolate oxidase iron-sulfur subunit
LAVRPLPKLKQQSNRQWTAKESSSLSEVKHRIAAEKLGAHGAAMAKAVEACVHCGFCLPDCPTYRELGQEMDSPRGRIVLMKEVLEGNLALSRALPHVDRCLGCLACETTCPSGVEYGELISPFRDYAESRRSRGIFSSLKRRFLSATLTHPDRFRRLARLATLVRPLRRILPRSLRAPLDLMPGKIPAPETLSSHYPAQGCERRGRISLLCGCAQQVLAPQINLATIDILTRHGIEVTIPKTQVCCGALAWHIGDGPRARIQARQNLKAFAGEIDAVITNAAGCGSGLQEYPLILAGTRELEAARAFATRVSDISVFLDDMTLAPPPDPGKKLKIAYHDACHLAHAQGVRDAPRRLLRSIPGIELIELPDANLCCGSAGTYNLDHPEIAGQLGAKKAALIANTGADMVASGNIGCLSQLKYHMEKIDCRIPIAHTVEIMAAAYRNELS